MPTKILIELTVAEMPSAGRKGLVQALRDLNLHGAQVTGVEAQDGVEGPALAMLLRLSLGAEPLAARLSAEWRGR